MTNCVSNFDGFKSKLIIITTCCKSHRRLNRMFIQSVKIFTTIKWMKITSCEVEKHEFLIMIGNKMIILHKPSPSRDWTANSTWNHSPMIVNGFETKNTKSSKLIINKFSHLDSLNKKNFWSNHSHIVGPLKLVVLFHGQWAWNFPLLLVWPERKTESARARQQEVIVFRFPEQHRSSFSPASYILLDILLSDPLYNITNWSLWWEDNEIG
jgi:hypothetical protein